MAITVVGGANIDITASCGNSFIAADSNPGRVETSYGGVGRNIAHNLVLMGAQVRFATVFGGDSQADGLVRDCMELGFDLSLSSRKDDARSSYYISINDCGGELVAGVSDMEVTGLMDTEWVRERLDALNGSEAVIFDANLATETIDFILTHCTAPLFADAVSATKSVRLFEALTRKAGLSEMVQGQAGQSQLPSARARRPLAGLKCNRIEALRMTGASDVGQAAMKLEESGVQRVFITLGGEGVLVRENGRATMMPALETEVRNVNGAGDAFIAAAVLAIVKGRTTQQAAQAGLRAASITARSVSAINNELKNLF